MYESEFFVKYCKTLSLHLINFQRISNAGSNFLRRKTKKEKKNNEREEKQLAVVIVRRRNKFISNKISHFVCSGKFYKPIYLLVYNSIHYCFLPNLLLKKNNRFASLNNHQ